MDGWMDKWMDGWLYYDSNTFNMFQQQWVIHSNCHVLIDGTGLSVLDQNPQYKQRSCPEWLFINHCTITFVLIYFALNGCAAEAWGEQKGNWCFQGDGFDIVIGGQGYMCTVLAVVKKNCCKWCTVTFFRLGIAVYFPLLFFILSNICLAYMCIICWKGFVTCCLKKCVLLGIRNLIKMFFF